MPNGKIGGDSDRGFAAGGDEAHLAPFTTAKPIAETIVRRDVLGFVRAEGLQALLGLIELGDVQLQFPLTDPPDDTFLHHSTDGILDWASAEGGEAEPVPIDWATIFNTPTTLAGYGITDAYTKAEIDAQRENDEALMRFHNR